MDKKMVLIISVIAVFLIFTSGVTHKKDQTYAEMKGYIYQNELNILATHYAKMGKVVEKYNDEVKLTSSKREIIWIHEEYLKELGKEIDNETDLVGINMDLQTMKNDMHNIFVDIYNHEIDKMNYIEGKITKEQWLKSDNQANMEIKQFNSEFKKLAYMYRTKYLSTFSSDMFYLLGEKPQQISYTVKKGDTLQTISQKFGTTTNEIQKVNHLMVNSVLTGQILKITK